MKNLGVSLITLIITIIVIIILAAIAIFSGLNTVDDAGFANFTNSVDTVQNAVYDAYSKLKTEHSLKGEIRTDEQIYIEIAVGADPGQHATMGTNMVYMGYKKIASASTGCQNIFGWRDEGLFNNSDVVKHSAAFTDEDKVILASLNPEEVDMSFIEEQFLVGDMISENKNSLNLPNLPLVKGHDDSWYITKDGKVFNSTGYTWNGKTYYNSNYYTKSSDLSSFYNPTRATEISKYMNGIDGKTGYDIKLSTKSVTGQT